MEVPPERQNFDKNENEMKEEAKDVRDSAVDKLIQEAKSAEPEAQLAAVRALRRLASDPCLPIIDYSGILPILVELASKDDNPSLQFEAASTLAYIAFDTSAQNQAAVEANAVPLFINLLDSPNLNVCELAMSTLESYFTDETREPTELYKEHSTCHLKMEFERTKMVTINRIFKKNSGRYFPCVRDLNQSNDEPRKTKRGKRELETPPKKKDFKFSWELEFCQKEAEVRLRLDQVSNEGEGMSDNNNNCHNDMYLNDETTSCFANKLKEEGNELYKASNYREAVEKYSEALNFCPETPVLYGNRAACYIMLAQYDRALEDAKTSIKIDPLFTKGYIRIARCCITTGDIASASQALETATGLEPNSSALTVEKNKLKTLQNHQTDATNSLNSGDHRQALSYLNCALEIATASQNLKLHRAECLAYLGRYGDALEVAHEVLDQDSINVDAIFVIGLCSYYDEENMDKALNFFKKVLRFAPDHHRAKDAYKKAKLLHQKKEDGNAAFKSSKWTEAYDLYTEALGIDPYKKFTNAKLYFNRATVAAKLKKLKESIEDCSAALALDEKYMKALLRRAKSYMDLEMFEEAVRDYEAVHRSDSSNLEYSQLLEHAKLELEKWKKSRNFYQILGVERGASNEEIKKAYKTKALVLHPDRHSNSTEEEEEYGEKFKEISEAYKVLSDATKRSVYDDGLNLNTDDLFRRGPSPFWGFGRDRKNFDFNM